MITVKLKIENEIDIAEDQRIFSDIVRIAFNRYQDCLSEKEIRAYIKPLFMNCNSWFVQNAIKSASEIYSRNKTNKVVFGGVSNLIRYIKGKITKDKYKSNRLFPISIQGERNHKGNRLFDFDLTNNTIVYKPSRKRHISIVYKANKNIKNKLFVLQELIEQKKITVSVRLTSEYVYLTFDESLLNGKKYEGLKTNRVLGLDLNPNYIGLSVIEFDNKDNFNVLHKEVIDFSLLTLKKNYNCNKLKHETIHAAYNISKLVDYWKCSKLAIEDLTIKSSDKGYGKHFNRLCNNVWERVLLINKLKSLSLINGFNLIEVNPCYSSFIGNIMYGDKNTPDMIAASIEIARRGYKKFSKGWFYPSIKNERIDERWKQTLSGFDNWILAFKEIKKAGMKYRFLLKFYILNAVFSKIYNQSKLKKYIFK